MNVIKAMYTYLLISKYN